MVSEIVLLLACNTQQGGHFLIPDLLINNMLTFLFDLRESILEETDKDHELAVEAEINIAQTIAKVLTSTNPVLVHDAHKFDSIKLMAKRLLASEVHHELLIFEGLRALTNIATCSQGSSDNYADTLVNMPF